MLDMTIHICNPSTVGARDGVTRVGSHPAFKFLRLTQSQRFKTKSGRAGHLILFSALHVCVYIHMYICIHTFKTELPPSSFFVFLWVGQVLSSWFFAQVI